MKGELVIRGGRILDPSRDMDGEGDLLIRDGAVAEIRPPGGFPAGGGPPAVDARGLWVAPGLVDLHVHLREPGFEYKETIASGAAAAAAGGFTSILAMANTKPVNDNAAVTRFVLRKAQEAASARVYPVGAATVDLGGETMTEMVEMAEAGCAAFSDDGKPVMNSFLMRKILEYLTFTGRPYLAHEEDAWLASGGAINEGRISTITGLRGIPGAAEEVLVARDLILAGLTGGRVHFCHLSTAGSVRLLARGKGDGLPVSGEVAPHHLFLTDEAVLSFDTATKVNPPLRSEEDRLALLQGLKDGVIDCIASDHAPHGQVDKELEYDRAAFGISGIETSLGLCLDLVHRGHLPPLRLIQLMSTAPARLAALPAGSLAPGSPADVVLIDPEAAWTVDRDRFLSRGRNTPFHGREIRGRAAATLVGGRPVFVHPQETGRFPADPA
jgi:dihydroorotase